MIITDRTRTEVDWDCGMKRYWLTEATTSEGAWGLVPVEEARELRFGGAYAIGTQHLALESAPAVTTIATTVTDYLKGEADARWGRVLEGLLWGYATYLLPRLREDYVILQVEPEVPLFYPAAPKPAELCWMARPDIVLQRISDQTIWVPDNKTTKWKDSQWLERWPWAIQLHMQAMAVQQLHPEWDVQGSLVLGAYKGYEREGEHYSPFLIGYRTVTEKGRVESARYVRGWEKFYPAAEDRSMEAWVAAMPADVLQEQFPCSPPIFLRTDRCEMVLEERLRRENRIEVWRGLGTVGQAVIMPGLFDHRTTHCLQCGYKAACFNPAVHADPCASGLYVPRIPNHELEKVVKG